MTQSSHAYKIEPLENRFDQHNMGMVVIDNEGNSTSYQSDQSTHYSEAQNMKSIVDSYISSTQGQNFLDYIEQNGRELVNITGVGSGDLGEHTVAAILKNDLEGVILSNYEGRSFSERVSEMANLYEIDTEAMTEYVLAHEIAHAAGYDTEADAEGFIRDYFTSQVFTSESKEEKEKYISLAKIADQRHEEAKENGE